MALTQLAFSGGKSSEFLLGENSEWEYNIHNKSTVFASGNLTYAIKVQFLS